MAYIYWIHPKNSLQGYVGQARNSEDALSRIYQHIAVAYGLPFSYRISWKDELQWRENAYDSPNLQKAIQENGVCNCDFMINNNPEDCYGVGMTAFEKFKQLWGEGYQHGGRGTAGLSDEDCMKLDLAEFVYATKYSYSGFNNESGGQGIFHYNTKPLAKKLEKISPSLAKALYQVDGQVTWMAQAQQKTSPLSNADFRMQSDDLLLYPEATAISFAFEQNLMNYFISSKELAKIITQTVAQNIDENEVISWLGLSLTGNKGSKKTTTGIQTSIKHLLKPVAIINQNNWNRYLKSAKINVRIEVGDETLERISLNIARILKKFIFTEHGIKSGQETIKWDFSKKDVVAYATKNETPSWYNEAGDFFVAFKENWNEQVKRICIYNFDLLYEQYRNDGGLNVEDNLKMKHTKPSFVLDNWDVYYQGMMNTIMAPKFGPLAFWPAGEKKYYYTRGEFVTSQQHWEMVDENKRILMQTNNTLTIW